MQVHRISSFLSCIKIEILEPLQMCLLLMCCQVGRGCCWGGRRGRERQPGGRQTLKNRSSPGSGWRPQPVGGQTYPNWTRWPDGLKVRHRQVWFCSITYAFKQGKQTRLVITLHMPQVCSACLVLICRLPPLCQTSQNARASLPSSCQRVHSAGATETDSSMLDSKELG